MDSSPATRYFVADTVPLTPAARHLIAETGPIEGRMWNGVAGDKFALFCQLAGFSPERLLIYQTNRPGVYLVGTADAYRRANGPSDERFEKLHRSFLAWCQYNPDDTIVIGTKSKVEKAERRVRRLQRELTTAIRTLEQKRRALQRMTGEPDDNELERLRSDLVALTKHPDLKKVAILDGTFRCWTKQIVVSYRGREYEMGEFVITMYDDGAVHFENLTRQVRGFPHPLVGDNGWPCLGDFEESIPVLIGQRHILIAVTLCLNYLRSYNEERELFPYTSITEWPQVSSLGGKRRV